MVGQCEQKVTVIFIIIVPGVNGPIHTYFKHIWMFLSQNNIGKQ